MGANPPVTGPVPEGASLYHGVSAERLGAYLAPLTAPEGFPRPRIPKTLSEALGHPPDTACERPWIARAIVVVYIMCIMYTTMPDTFL